MGIIKYKQSIVLGVKLNNYLAHPKMSKTENVAENGGIRGIEPEFMDVNPNFTEDNESIRTRYYDIGEGKPIVLVHGGNPSGASNANTWGPNLEGLSGEHRVIAYDRLACGMTDNPKDIDDFIYMSEIDHAISFLEEIGEDSYHLVGSSRGAGHIVRLAVEQPELAESITILNSGTLGPLAGDKEFRRDRIFDRYKPDFDPTDPADTRYRYEMYCHQTDHITNEYCETTAWMRDQPKAHETARIMEDEDHDSTWRETMINQRSVSHERIKNGVLDMPVHYIFGRNDLTVRLETGIAAYDMIAQTNPDVRMTIFNNSGHLIYREHAEEFNETVVDFINRMCKD